MAHCTVLLQQYLQETSSHTHSSTANSMDWLIIEWKKSKYVHVSVWSGLLRIRFISGPYQLSSPWQYVSVQNKTSPECLNKIAKVNKLSDFANYSFLGSNLHYFNETCGRMAKNESWLSNLAIRLQRGSSVVQAALEASASALIYLLACQCHISK